ncbi:MAG: ATP-binding protein [Lysobacter sp.]|nr:ATP-binding protein [Lysobacter sp.]
MPDDQAIAGRPAPVCERHGVAKDAIAAAPNRAQLWICPKCADEDRSRATRLAHFDHDQKTRAAEQQRKQADLERRIGAACIPERYRDYTFDTFPNTDERAVVVLQRMRTYANRWYEAKKRGVSVLLLGDVGTGKTGIACATANQIVRMDHQTALFITAYGAVRHMRDTWGRKGKTEREALDDLLLPDLLILEEVGANVGSDAEMTALFEVLNGRYAARKPTFVLSNLPLDDFRDAAGSPRPGLQTFLGQRVIDRFRDDGSFVVSLDWPSLRGARK